jgi:hypothetical protein
MTPPTKSIILDKLAPFVGIVKDKAKLLMVRKMLAHSSTSSSTSSERRRVTVAQTSE